MAQDRQWHGVIGRRTIRGRELTLKREAVVNDPGFDRLTIEAHTCSMHSCMKLFDTFQIAMIQSAPSMRIAVEGPRD